MSTSSPSHYEEARLLSTGWWNDLITRFLEPPQAIEMSSALLGQTLLESILNQLPIGILLYDSQGSLLFFNAHANRLLRFAQGHDKTWSLQGRQNDCYGSTFPLPLSQVLSGETVIDCTERVNYADGSYSDILISGSPLRNTQQILIGALIICVDSSTRKDVDETIHQQLADISRAQAMTETGTWRLDMRHNRLRWSEQTYQMFGIPRATDLTYEMFLSTVHPDDQGYVDQSWLAALRGEPYDIEHRIIVGNEIKWVRERAELEFDTQGNLAGGFGTVQNITERKLAESQLQSVARFPSENPNPVLRISREGVVLYANEASDLIRCTWDCQVGDILPQPWLDIVFNAAQSKQTQELEIECKEQVFFLQFMPIPDNDYVNIYGRDITERKQAEDRQHVLQNLVADLAKALTPGDVASVVIEQGMKAVGASAGAVAVLTTNNPMLEIIGASGYPKSAIDTGYYTPIHNLSPLLTQVIRGREPLFVGSLEDSLAYSLWPLNMALDGQQAWAILPLLIHERVIGLLQFSFRTPRYFDKTERGFLLAIADYCAQTLERCRLAEKEKEAATIQERHRFARDLHDAVSQVLFASATIAEALPQIWERSPERIGERLKQVLTLNRAAMAEMRGLLLELRPEAIEKVSLAVLLTQLIAAAKGRKHLEANLRIEGNDSDLAPEVVKTIYRIAQESINNILKHSQATRFDMTLYQCGPQQIQLSIVDNGKGFDLTREPLGGLGLRFMQERAQGIGARLEIDSNPGKGTCITVIWSESPGPQIDAKSSRNNTVQP